MFDVISIKYFDDIIDRIIGDRQNCPEVRIDHIDSVVVLGGHGENWKPGMIHSSHLQANYFWLHLNLLTVIYHQELMLAMRLIFAFGSIGKEGLFINVH